MKIVKRIWDAIFDFFCGDYRVLIGVAVTVALTACIDRIAALHALRPVAGVVLTAGILLSFVWAMLHASRKQ